MQTNPLISIVIPVYNGANFLKKAIDSALAQTYENIEILVINDGSNDNGETERIALAYGNRIRYFYKENGGISTALNTGIKEMSGEYFSWLSHDDEYTATKIEKQVEQLKRGADIIVCSEYQIDEDSKAISAAVDYSEMENKGVISWDYELSNVIQNKIFHGCALLIPKYVFEKVGLFNEELRYNQDFDMWSRICFEKYSWAYHNDVGVLGRIHNNQVTQTRRDLFYGDSYKLGQTLIPKLSELSSADYNYLLMYAKRCAKYNLNRNVDLCIREMKNKGLYSFYIAIILRMISVYGRMRPLIRRLYYLIFKKVKTK